MFEKGEVSQFVSGKYFSKLEGPFGIAIYRRDNSFLVTSYEGHKIYKVTSSGFFNFFFVIVLFFSYIYQGNFFVLAGNGKDGSVDGDGPDASFSQPWGITVDQQTGIIYVCDSKNHQIRKITPYGMISFHFPHTFNKKIINTFRSRHNSCRIRRKWILRGDWARSTISCTGWHLFRQC